MKLVRFLHQPGGSPRPGVLTQDGRGVVPLDHLCRGGDVLDLIGRRVAIEAAMGGEAIALAAVTLCAPLARPARNLFCVGKNYHAHAEEFHRSGFDASAGAAAVPDHPIVFTKAPGTVIGPGAPIPAHLDDTGSTDYEGELAVVIGTGGRAIPRDRAMAHVWGYTVANDVTARNLQKDHRQWFLGKSIDGFCPLGPCIVPAEDLPDLGAVRLTTHVNGRLRQDAVLGDLIFDIPTLIETLSRRITLEPGDVILTGTPEGVGIGMAPPVYLKPGDVVRVEIGGIGVLENPVA